MVLRVRDLSDIFPFDTHPILSDEFDCSEWLLFEVRTHCDQSTTTLIRTADSSSSGRIGEGPGSSEGELDCCMRNGVPANLTSSHRYSPEMEFSLPTFRKRGWCGHEYSHLRSQNRHGVNCRLVLPELLTPLESNLPQIIRQTTQRLNGIRNQNYKTIIGFSTVPGTCGLLDQQLAWVSGPSSSALLPSRSPYALAPNPGQSVS